MSFSRQVLNRSSNFRAYLRPFPRTTIQPYQARFASSDYGSGDGDPAGEKPQEQGKSKATRDREHPGPSAPDVGQTNKSASGTEAKQDDQRSPNANAEVQGKKPKITHEPHPQQDESVKEHNDEVERRKERMGQSKHAHNANE
ncbi:hypothetical protein EJ05DRAFT_473660 [Pseudovirgaria hyperparasitica]|uniref:Uncharacterized protein n=1 Tax=Pseudovirgaria hyperparasitica TaxID=470096 RepID=A0A6A6WIQ9_9PEZI|nr:uncharacterized protein EJ05DRAFT_473660 [Pseudovirgaria hyperparasitica]KAF2761101.1 hypothetical protein EJ05DRAFT_473660 [Pseudovirgaria hyperparasitica]